MSLSAEQLQNIGILMIFIALAGIILHNIRPKKPAPVTHYKDLDMRDMPNGTHGEKIKWLKKQKVGGMPIKTMDEATKIILAWEAIQRDNKR